MDIKPVKNIEKPKYPIKEDITADALKRFVPKRWSTSAAAKVALGTLAAMSLAGCAPVQTAGVPLPPSATTEESFWMQTNTPVITFSQTAGVPEPSQTPEVSVFAGVPAPVSISVAPLFLHGEGRGAFGCVMVAQPVFLSEEDALAVVNEAAKEFGLLFSSQDSPEFSNVLQPVTDLNPQSSNGPASGTKNPDAIMTLKTDFADNEHKIAIEFVSVDDVKAWQQTPSGASVEEYLTQDAAAQLSEALEDAFSTSVAYTAAVLYDPCAYSDEADAKPIAQELLKAQATDFFNWLHQQGII